MEAREQQQQLRLAKYAELAQISLAESKEGDETARMLRGKWEHARDQHARPSPFAAEFSLCRVRASLHGPEQAIESFKAEFRHHIDSRIS